MKLLYTTWIIPKRIRVTTVKTDRTHLTSIHGGRYNGYGVESRLLSKAKREHVALAFTAMHGCQRDGVKRNGQDEWSDALRRSFRRLGL